MMVHINENRCSRLLRNQVFIIIIIIINVKQFIFQVHYHQSTA